MTTRRPSSSAVALALAALAWAATAPAQNASAEESAIRSRYDVSHWAHGAAHAGVVLARVAVPGLALRARTDRSATEGGVSLAFGSRTTTLRVRIAVAADDTSGTDALIGFLRTSQADLVAMVDRHGADVALGDSPRGEQSAYALFGNVAVAVDRTRDAGSETPSAWEVLETVRSALAAGAASMPALTLVPSGTHVDVRGATVDHVEATVRGGHLHGVPSLHGIDVVADGPGTIELRVVATDALGRVAVGTASWSPNVVTTR